jgi:UPF0716 protein FxsA
MLPLILLIFIAAPIIELTILFKLGNWIGWLPTLALVFGAGLAGAAVARIEGWKAAMRLRQQLASGVLPAAQMFDGLLIGAAGMLLLLPGLVSDVLGLVLLLPPVRTLVRRSLMHWVRKNFRVQVIGGGADENGGPQLPSGDKIIDARVIQTRVMD